MDEEDELKNFSKVAQLFHMVSRTALWISRSKGTHIYTKPKFSKVKHKKQKTES